jgi:hypothetical protein
MNEKAKIQEAKFFLSLMVKEQENREAFKYFLSAFLSAARLRKGRFNAIDHIKRIDEGGEGKFSFKPNRKLRCLQHQ